MFQIPSATSEYAAYMKFPSIMILKPIEEEAVIQFAYHVSLIKQQRKQEQEVEKICDWYMKEFIPLRVQLVWHKMRVERVRDIKIPTLYEIQLNHYNRYISEMNQKPKRLSNRGELISSIWCGYSGYMS
jgi:hypothetical protein